MTANPTHSAVITGIGLVTSLGVGASRHVDLMTGETPPAPNVDTARYTPYPIHPLPEIDWSAQIPRRGDQRQMDEWQRLGVFSAGLALDDAGFKEDLDACARMDMIVAAGGGERDLAVDTMIIDEAANRSDRDVLLNEKLTTELRPTLFLSQLSNLMAGNISIVHKVTGSSRTFMGEEAAGISAIETALARIQAGQSTHALVGGAHVAERPDMHFVYETDQALLKGAFRPVWQRADGNGDGLVPGSVGVFLVLEEESHARQRGGRIYARLDGAAADRGTRNGSALEDRLSALGETVGWKDAGIVFSGATGRHDPTSRERDLLRSVLTGTPVRATGTLTGHALEAEFPLGIALAALAISSGKPVQPFDADMEKPVARGLDTAIVTTVGYVRGEGMARLSALKG